MANPKLISAIALTVTKTLTEGSKLFLDYRSKNKENVLKSEIEKEKIVFNADADKRKNTTGIIAASLLSGACIYAIKKFNDDE
ncbi:hypothetical protein [Komagataeibacter sp. FNDCF1]|uniref:hypothetical protein n=1 Tax=Komagataeibacter sp. FNDCF1 TaxID=2878681 RepID=UPI001E568BC2|nr:hypothetical protein [Komagataeibacter sp. FNDCF1]MCE2565734.1 hypothetical protein [Komagataeibacter sp. FNDCF1]